MINACKIPTPKNAYLLLLSSIMKLICLFLWTKRNSRFLEKSPLWALPAYGTALNNLGLLPWMYILFFFGLKF